MSLLFRHSQTTREAKSEPPIVFASERALVDDLKKLSKHLEGLAEEWTVRVGALNRLQKIVQDGAYKRHAAVFLEHLNGKVRDGVIQQLGDSRSAVSVVAAQCIKTLAVVLEEQLDVDPYVAAIVRIMGTTNQVIKDAAHNAMLAIIESSRLGRAGVGRLVETVLTSKSAAQRQRATEYLRRVVSENARYGNGTLDKAVDEIEGAVRKALSDGDPTVRVEARQAFRAYCNAWSARGEAFLESLDPSVKKYIVLPSSSVSQGAKTTTIAPSPTATKTLTVPSSTATAKTSKLQSSSSISSKSSNETSANFKTSSTQLSGATLKRLNEKRHLQQTSIVEAKKIAVGSQKPTPVPAVTTTTSATQKLHASVTAPRAPASTQHPTIVPRVDVSLAIKYGSKDSVELKRKAIIMLKQAVQSGGGSNEEPGKGRTEKPGATTRKRDPRVAINIAPIASLLRSVLSSDVYSSFEEDALAVILGLFEGYANEASCHLDDILTPVFTRLSKNSEHSELCEHILGAALTGVKIDYLLGFTRKHVFCRGSGPGMESYAVLVFLEKVLEHTPESFEDFQCTKSLALSLAVIPISSSPKALKDKAVEVLHKLYGIAKDNFKRALKTLPPSIYSKTVEHLPFIDSEETQIDIKVDYEENKEKDNENENENEVIMNENENEVIMNENENEVIMKDNKDDDIKKDNKMEMEVEIEEYPEEKQENDDGENEIDNEIEKEIKEISEDLEEIKEVDEGKEEQENEEEKEEKEVEETTNDTKEENQHENKKAPSTPQIIKEKAMGVFHSISGIARTISASVYSSAVKHLSFKESTKEENKNENIINEENDNIIEEKENENIINEEKEIIEKEIEDLDSEINTIEEEIVQNDNKEPESN